MDKNKVNTPANVEAAIAKGSVKLIPVFGSVGNVTKDFNTGEVVAGQYRHTQTVEGTSYSWKCAKVELTGVVKLVRDEFDSNGEVKGFWRMEGLVDNAAVVTKTRETLVALQDMEF